MLLQTYTRSTFFLDTPFRHEGIKYLKKYRSRARTAIIAIFFSYARNRDLKFLEKLQRQQRSFVIQGSVLA